MLKIVSTQDPSPRATHESTVVDAPLDGHGVPQPSWVQPPWRPEPQSIIIVRMMFYILTRRRRMIRETRNKIVVVEYSMV